MRRPQAVGLGAVMLGLLVTSMSPAAALAGRSTGHGPVRTPPRQITADAFVLARTAKEAVRAGTTDEKCTGWRSTLFPPQTIRVLQTRGPDAGKVYREPLDPTGMTPREIPFREYVGIVIAAEWPAYYPQEVLKAGALAVKQYAWYYTVVYRGGVDVDGNCYDVKDNTDDQWYQPETRVAAPSHLKAIDATWTMHLRKTERTTTGRGKFILTGYRAGTNVPCGSDSNSWHLRQRSAYNCGIDGLNMEQVLREYVEPRLEIITPGRHDIVGPADVFPASLLGDVAAVVEGPKGVLVPHVWQSRRTALSTAEATTIEIGGEGLLGQASEDVNGDGWDDLVMARRTGPDSLRLSLARSDGTGYLDPESWWAGSVGRDPDGARLFTGDFNGDMRGDVALLVPGPKDTYELLVFARKKGTGFQAPVPWWTGTIDPAITQVLAGDMNGDGRHDLLLITDLGEGGREYRIARSAAPTAGLGQEKLKYRATDLVGDTVKHVLADVTRDGRDDVLLVIDLGTRTGIDILRPTASNIKMFTRSQAWRSSTDGRLPLAKIKLATSDVDNDGLMDLVVFRDRGESGTEIATFVTAPKVAYGRLSPGMSITDATVDWGSLRPY